MAGPLTVKDPRVSYDAYRSMNCLEISEWCVNTPIIVMVTKANKIPKTMMFADVDLVKVTCALNF